MTQRSIEATQDRLERLTRRWWFFVLIALLQMVPAYTTRGYRPEDTGMVVGEILSGCYLYEIPFLYPIFKILPLVLVGLMIRYGANGCVGRVARVLGIYAAVNYVLIAVLQSVGVSEVVGFGVLIGNLIMFLLVAAAWGWEAVARRNDLSLRGVPLWKYWVVPPAFLAFWFPANPETMLPDFRPALFFTNEAGLTFCMTTPVYLAILTLIHPKVNYVTLRVHSLVGIIIGLYNMLLGFVISPADFWWYGVLHIPLVVISLYAFVLSFRSGTRRAAAAQGTP